MGKRGPKPKPNAVKIAEGTRPCRMNKGEVVALPGLGDPPEWFDEASRNLWNRIVTEAPPNVLTVSDRWMVEEWIKLTAELVECRNLIREQGMSVTENRGSDQSTYTITKANPLLPTLTNIRKQWVAIADRFGFSPSARASLSAELPKQPSRFAEYLNRGKSDG